jgi:very-short-patch-repair endonuclease
MQNPREATPQALKLFNALKEKGIDSQIQYNDGHKTVDIAVLKAKLFIEVDGIQHFTNSEQIKRDFKRSHYSDGDDYSTFYVTNQIIDTHLDEVVDALVEVINSR